MGLVSYSFLLTILAGLSTLIGTIIIFINKTDKIIIGCLSFAAGVMITVSLVDLIPESFLLVSDVFFNFPAIILCLIFFVIGIIISMLIDYFFPSDLKTNNITEHNKNLYRVGIISMVAIILHNIPEGMATFMTSNSNLELGITLTTAIALHNIPEGICIAVPIYYATKSRARAFKYTLISALSEPFGAIIAFAFFKPIINDVAMGFLYSIIAGIMIHISIYELLPTALKFKKYLKSIIFLIIGCLLMLINHLI